MRLKVFIGTTLSMMVAMSAPALAQEPVPPTEDSKPGAGQPPEAPKASPPPSDAPSTNAGTNAPPATPETPPAETPGAPADAASTAPAATPTVSEPSTPSPESARARNQTPTRERRPSSERG